MKNYKPGNLVWVSRFSPHGFSSISNSFETEPTVSTISEIFITPQQYKIMEMYPIRRNHSKWVLILAPTVENDEHSGDCQLFTAALLETPQHDSEVSTNTNQTNQQFLMIELDSAQDSGKCIATADDFYIGKRKSVLYKRISQKVQKFVKAFKKEHKYNKMNLIQSCLFKLKTPSQLHRMVQKNPQDFV